MTPTVPTPMPRRGTPGSGRDHLVGDLRGWSLTVDRRRSVPADIGNTRGRGPSVRSPLLAERREDPVGRPVGLGDGARGDGVVRADADETATVGRETLPHQCVPAPPVRSVFLSDVDGARPDLGSEGRHDVLGTAVPVDQCPLHRDVESHQRRTHEGPSTDSSRRERRVDDEQRHHTPTVRCCGVEGGQVGEAEVSPEPHHDGRSHAVILLRQRSAVALEPPDRWHRAGSPRDSRRRGSTRTRHGRRSTR